MDTIKGQIDMMILEPNHFDTEIALRDCGLMLTNGLNHKQLLRHCIYMMERAGTPQLEDGYQRVVNILVDHLGLEE